VIEYVPSAIVGNVHEPVVAVATKVHVTEGPDAGLAVNVIVAPEVNPPIFMVGVLSFVILSVLEVPVSDAVASVGVPVETNAPIAIVRVKTPNNTVSDFPPNS
jgi:hypothetical protein